MRLCLDTEHNLTMACSYNSVIKYFDYMSFSFKQTHVLQVNWTDQGNRINTTEQGSKKRVWVRHGRRTPCVEREDDKVRQIKRKAGDEREDDKKRRRRRSKRPNACRISDAHTDNVGALKRKASSEREVFRERDGASCTASDPINAGNVLEYEVEEVELTRVKRKATADPAPPSEGTVENALPKVNTSRDEFEAKYQQLRQIGQGACGTVYAGIRLDDLLPVAIKRDQSRDVVVDMKVDKIPNEVALMQRASCGSESIGKFAAVSILDWYYVDRELIIVMERPPECMTLFSYMMQERSLVLSEEKAKILTGQLVEGAIDLHKKGVCHQDLKVTNVLVDLSSTAPRLRIIDFGIGALVQDEPYHTYKGPSNLGPPEFMLYKSFRAVPIIVWQIGTLLYRMLHGKRFDVSFCVGDKFGVSPKFSQDCNDFLQLCLTTNPETRGTLQQLRKHPWLDSPSDAV